MNQFTSNIVRHAMDLGLLETHLEMLRRVYRSRLEVMNATLTAAFGVNATWICPEGGYFFWIKLDENVDAGKLKQIAIEHKTGFQTGEFFSSCGGLKNYIRLSFANYNESEIKEGIVQLKVVFGL